MIEADLYGAIKDYFEENGYQVKGEVNSCDVVCLKEDFIVIVEMKTKLNLEVILQAVQRQKLDAIVYIAVPKEPKKKGRYKEILDLLKRLELGLLLVRQLNEQSIVEEVLSPKNYLHKKHSSWAKERQKLLKEFHERISDNRGGITRTKIMTSYKEKAIQVATILHEKGELSIKELKTFGCDERKTGPILRDNHYGWFEKVTRGLYRLTPKGIEALEEYPSLVLLFKKNLEQ